LNVDSAIIAIDVTSLNVNATPVLATPVFGKLDNVPVKGSDGKIRGCQKCTAEGTVCSNHRVRHALLAYVQQCEEVKVQDEQEGDDLTPDEIEELLCWTAY